MRSALAALLLAGCTTAAADNPPPRPSWAEWVGDWTGPLAWRSCAVDGNKSATLALEATDGALSIDLAPAGNRLEKLSLVPDSDAPARLTAQTADVTLRLDFDKGTWKLHADMASGCQLDGKLSRASTGTVACDRLAAWTRIEAKCTKLPGKPLDEDPKLKDLKKATAAACDARSAKLATELIDAGCAPSPDLDLGTRATSCRALVAEANALDRCAKAPAEVRHRLVTLAMQMAAAAQTATKAELPTVESQCEDARGQIRSFSKDIGC